MSTKELEALVGEKIAAKVVFVLVGDRWFRRVDGDEFEECPSDD